jgi:hypothetical protein
MMTIETIDREEQERRRHIRQWARFMITHLEGTDEARYLSYTQSLARLRDLIELELARVEGGPRDEAVPEDDGLAQVTA